MTKTGKLYGDSLYELALEKDVEQHTYSKELLDELRIVKSLFDENPDYIRLLQEPSIPRKTRTLDLLIRHLARRLMSIL